MVFTLWLPILLSAVALFFASFLSWMVLPIHKQDWVKMNDEDEFMQKVRDLGVPNGSYTFPGWDSPEEMKSKEFQKKFEKGPCGIITVYPKVNMGKNLGLTFAYFLASSFCLGYLATMACDPGAEFMQVFRFVATAGLMTFLSAIVQHAIWFHNRIIGHVIESLAYAIITGVIFAALWPAAAA
ncbi:MAG: hypothetical protein ACI9HK_001650 [Pirellulaceae bacterium]|jgi:hypothetical protein